MVVLVHEVVHVEWAEVDPQEAICNREQGTGSVQIRVVATRTLPGGWSVTSAKLPNQKDWVVAPPFLQVVTEAEVEWECVEEEAWTAVGQQELVALVDQEVSVEAGEETAVVSGGVVEWTEEDSVGPGVEDHLWTEWVAEVEEEWDHQVERWI